MNEVIFSLWTPESIITIDANGNTRKQEDNPYGILPFVPIWGAPVTDYFWQRGARDLIMAQDEINRLLTTLGYVVDLQGFSLACMRGVPADDLKEKFKFGPGQVLCLSSEKADFKFESPDAPIEHILTGIDKLIKWAAITSGLSANAVSTDVKEMSGLARMVSNSEMNEIRRDDIALFTQYERKLFDTYRIIWNYHNPGNILSEDAKFSINFADSRPYIDPRDQMAVWQELLSMGLFSPVDIMQEIDPDLSREEAIERIQRVQEDMLDYAQGYSKDPDFDNVVGSRINKIGKSLLELARSN